MLVIQKLFDRPVERLFSYEAFNFYNNEILLYREHTTLTMCHTLRRKVDRRHEKRGESMHTHTLSAVP